MLLWYFVVQGVLEPNLSNMPARFMLTHYTMHTPHPLHTFVVMGSQSSLLALFMITCITTSNVLDVEKRTEFHPVGEH